MILFIPCSRCGVATSTRKMYCTFCGHMPWAHPGSCDCGQCCALFNVPKGVDAIALAGSGPPPVAGDGPSVSKGGGK